MESRNQIETRGTPSDNNSNNNAPAVPEELAIISHLKAWNDYLKAKLTANGSNLEAMTEIPKGRVFSNNGGGPDANEPLQRQLNEFANLYAALLEVEFKNILSTVRAKRKENSKETQFATLKQDLHLKDKEDKAGLKGYLSDRFHTMFAHQYSFEKFNNFYEQIFNYINKQLDANTEWMMYETIIKKFESYLDRSGPFVRAPTVDSDVRLEFMKAFLFQVNTIVYKQTVDRFDSPLNNAHPKVKKMQKEAQKIPAEVQKILEEVQKIQEEVQKNQKGNPSLANANPEEDASLSGLALAEVRVKQAQKIINEAQDGTEDPALHKSIGEMHKRIDEMLERIDKQQTRRGDLITAISLAQQKVAADAEKYFVQTFQEMPLSRERRSDATTAEGYDPRNYQRRQGPPNFG